MSKITRAEWETDVKNTEKELKAYKMIAEGFRILVFLPEDDPKATDHYRHLRTHYLKVAAQCKTFLTELKGLEGREFPLEMVK